jgi:hypothetical protein
MLYKFVLINKTTQDSKEYKTLREISNELSIDYFQIRSVYLESKKPKKFLHPITKQIVDKYEIKDNPNLFNYLH